MIGTLQPSRGNHNRQQKLGSLPSHEVGQRYQEARILIHNVQLFTIVYKVSSEPSTALIYILWTISQKYY